ncbi:HAD-like domain-containing protein, partial [Neohortaea acidophila]
PAPSWDYLRKASEAPELLGTPRGLLVILDTNGTLLSRQKAKGRSSLIPRPGVARFLDYLLKRHKVMIWSSAGLGTVNTICHQLLLPKQIRRLVAIWSRDDLGMTPEQYRSKGPIFKRLSRVWQDSDIQQHRAVATQAWSQQNTVLIDNTPDKAASEPYNNIAIRTFAGGNSEAEDDLFGPVIEYLDMLRSQRNVSAYIR